MRKNFKRLLSFIICLSMCVTLLSAMPAAAESLGFTPLQEDKITATDTTASALTAAKVTSGPVFKLVEEKDSDGKPTGYYRVDLGLYNMPGINVFNLNFYFDPNVVEMVGPESDRTALTVPANGKIGASEKERLIVGATYGNELLTASGQENIPTADRNMFNEDNGPFTLESLTAFGLDSENKPTGEIMIVVISHDNVDSSYFYNVDTSGGSPLVSSYPDDTVMNFCSMNFKVKEGKKVAYNTFAVAQDDNAPTGCYTSGSDDYDYNAVFVDFPEPPEETKPVQFTIKSGETPIEGAVIYFENGTTEGGNSITDYNTDDNLASRTTNTSGVATVELPLSGSGGYWYKVQTVTDDTTGKTYEMNEGDSTSGVHFTVELAENEVMTDTTVVAEYSRMVEETAEYTFTLEVKAEDGKAVTLDGSTFKFGSATPSTTGAGSSLEFVTKEKNTREFTLSGIQGYQKVTGTVKITPDESVENEATLSEATGDGVALDGTKTIVVTLKPIVTKVTIPVPVPTAEDGTNITPEQAAGLEVTFTPEGGATIKADVTATDSNSDGKVDSVTAVAPLPDGTYTMTVGGTGLESQEKTVTVVTVYDADGNPTTIVNIGGTVTTDPETGDVTTTGGVTAVGGNPEGDDSGNNTVDLTGGADNTVIKEAGEGGTVTVDPESGSTSETGTVEDITEGGFLGSEVAGDLGTGTITDPIYEVRVIAKTEDNYATVKKFEVEVYLKNAVASSGTFGLYFDPLVFGEINDSNIVIDPLAADGDDATAALNIEADHTIGGVEYKNNYEEGSYVFFGWRVKEGGDADAESDVSEVNAKSKEQHIATITLPVLSGITAIGDLKPKLDNRSVYTMDFARTEEGKEAIKWATDPSTGTVIDELLTQTMGGTWRRIDMDGTKGHVPLSDEKATRGGFYQIYAPNTDKTESVAHDIRMEFVLDEIIENYRADFFVSEPGTGTPIVDALVEIYETPYDPANPPEAIISDDTDNYGYVDFRLDKDKTYYYRVTDGSHWAYPDGTSKTASDNLDYDSFILRETGNAELSMNVFPNGSGGYTTTPITNDYINPQMEPRTFHIVGLELSSTADPSATLEAVISGDNQAKNGVDYYFTISPKSTHQWKDGLDMNTVAAGLNAQMYGVNASATTVTDAFRAGTPTPVEVTWDAGRQQFKILGSLITGDHINVNEISDGAGGTIDVDVLRAGDIVLSFDPTWIEFAKYTITGTAGTGGTVSWEPSDDTSLTGDSDLDAVYTSNAADVTDKQEIVENLSNGRTTSGKFIFKPLTGTADTYVINTVTVNGVSLTLTDEQKKAASFEYEFKDIAADQNIYVTFAKVDPTDPDNPDPVSDGQINVIVGINGSATVTGANPATDSVAGGTSKIYYVANGTAVSVEAVPETSGDPQYEIDSIILNGVDVTASAIANSNTVRINVANSESNTIAITFRPVGGDTTHVVVTSQIVDGFGELVPIGVEIRPVGDQIEYTMTPADNWKLVNQDGANAVVVNGIDFSKNATTADSKVYTYKTEPLTKDTTVDITFSEKTYTVRGKIRLTDGTNNSTVAPAMLYFEREAGTDPLGLKDATPVEEPSGTQAKAETTDYRTVEFTVELPAGTWNLRVEKQGYLHYTIEDFEVKVNNTGTTYDIIFGNAASDGTTEVDISTSKPIPLIPGDAQGEGVAVGFGDTSVVVAGWLPTALPNNKLKGDINESNFTKGGGSDVYDIGYVLTYMYNIRETKAYSDFLLLP